MFCPHIIVISARVSLLHNFMKYLLIKCVFYPILYVNICVQYANCIAYLQTLLLLCALHYELQEKHFLRNALK